MLILYNPVDIWQIFSGIFDIWYGLIKVGYSSGGSNSGGPRPGSDPNPNPSPNPSPNQGPNSGPIGPGHSKVHSNNDEDEYYDTSIDIKYKKSSSTAYLQRKKLASEESLERRIQVFLEEVKLHTKKRKALEEKEALENLKFIKELKDKSYISDDEKKKLDLLIEKSNNKDIFFNENYSVKDFPVNLDILNELKKQKLKGKKHTTTMSKEYVVK